MWAWRSRWRSGSQWSRWSARPADSMPSPACWHRCRPRSQRRSSLCNTPHPRDPRARGHPRTAHRATGPVRSRRRPARTRAGPGDPARCAHADRHRRRRPAYQDRRHPASTAISGPAAVHPRRRPGPRAVAVILTGGGTDGSLGAQAIHAFGGHVLVQDQASSKQYGMPGAAVNADSPGIPQPLDDIGQNLLALLQPRVTQAAPPNGTKLDAGPAPPGGHSYDPTDDPEGSVRQKRPPSDAVGYASLPADPRG
jgi:hypothetical protein